MSNFKIAYYDYDGGYEIFVSDIDGYFENREEIPNAYMFMRAPDWCETEYDVRDWWYRFCEADEYEADEMMENMHSNY